MNGVGRASSASSAREQLVPVRGAVPPGEVAPRLLGADSADGRDPVGAPLEVLAVGAERLLHRRKSTVDM